MSELYSIQDTTLTALGDAVRSKVMGTTELPISTISEQFIQYNKAYSFEFPAYVKKIKIVGTGRYTMVWDGNANGYQGVGIAPGKYTSEHETRKAEGYIVAYTFDMDTLYDEKYFDFEAMVEGNSFTLVASKASSNSTNYYLTYTAIGLDENGNEFKYTPLEMVDKINELNIPNIQPIVLTGSQAYGCSGQMASAFIKNFGDKVSTNNIYSATNNMFQSYENETIPFDININTTTSYATMNSMFSHCEKLRELPRFNYAYPGAMGGFCEYCYNLRDIPDDYFDVFNFSRMQTYASASFGSIFSNCYSLRKIPDSLLRNLWGIQTSMSYVPYSSLIFFCYAMDECNGLPIHQSKLNNNVFSSTVGYAGRLKNFTFETNEDGSAKTATWKSQTFDFSQYTGWLTTSYDDVFAKYNSGITADKEVKDEATYQALKNDPDWFTSNINYSRYNHDSAVNTINSLPDTSAYGTNTIKFKGASGALTDGGAINTLTEEEIAVATAKGWSVALV